MSRKPQLPKVTPKKANGRPSIYTEELADLICRRVATNPVGLPTICKMFPDLPDPDTIRVWRWDRPIFSAKYVEAKRHQAELMAESIEDLHAGLIADVYHDDNGVKRLDSGLVAATKLAIDSRKWTASKLAPKIYGDKQHTEVIVKHEDDLKHLG